MTLNDLLLATTRRSRQRAAMVYFGQSISYSQFLEEVERAACGLQSIGVRRGDRVALLLQNCPQFAIGYFAALRCGAIVTSTSPIYTSREVSHQWKDAGVRVAIVDEVLRIVVEGARSSCPGLERIVWTQSNAYKRPSARRLKEYGRTSPKEISQATQDLDWGNLLSYGRRPSPVIVRPGDVACLQYTGGTTGVSKGAMLTHANLVINAEQTCGWLTGGKVRRETMIAALPLFHIYATTCVMISAIFCGGTVIILPRFELSEVLKVVRKYRPTLFHGVPTMYVAFNGVANLRRYGFHRLRTCMSGGAPLPVAVQQQFELRTGAKLVEGYGLTESSPVTHINPLGKSRAGSIGVAVPRTQARIVDLKRGLRELPIGEAGELIIKGPQVMKGYWRKSKETAHALRKGWLFTGDIARVDPDGFYYIADRKKDLILVGGFNVYPREVEEVLFEHPAIKEAAVVGVPDGYRGESVKAFVVCRPGMSASVEEIISFSRERLAAYKVPRAIEFLDSLPRSGVGKYLRRELRKPK